MPEQLSFQGFAALPVVPGSVFLALRPGVDAAVDIASCGEQLRREFDLKARLLGAALFHVSLHYLGDGLPQSKIDKACAVAATIVAPPFDIIFDRVASFGGNSKSRPVVLFGTEGVAALKEFHQTLGLALQKAGLVRGNAKSYTPHMTMLYDARRIEEQAFGPFTWNAREFCLVRSLVGQHKHVVLGRWPLRTERDKQ